MTTPLPGATVAALASLTCCKGDNDKAIADCTEAIEHDPKCAFAYFVRGSAYEQKGDLDHSKAWIASERLR